MKRKSKVKAPAKAKKPGRKPIPALRWTLLRAAEEFDVARETIRRGLKSGGVDAEKDGGTYTTRQIFCAIAGNLEAEKIRLTRADADVREMEKAELANRLVPMELAKQVIADALGPVRSKLMAMPSTLAVRCNPSDPELARAELETFVEQTLANVARS